MDKSPLQKGYYIEEKNTFSMKDFFSGIFGFLYGIMQNIVLLCAIFLLLYIFIIAPHVTDGISMEPNFCNGDIYLAEKITPYMNSYEHGQVIAFKHDDANDYVKRIIGLSGDTIRIEQGQVYRNGLLLQESYLPQGRQTELYFSDGLQEGKEYTVPHKSIFVMGDNRPNSTDSRRFLAIEPEVNTVKGRVLFVVWPLDRARILENSTTLDEMTCQG